LQSGFWGDFYKLTNQKQELPMVAMFVTGSERNEQSLYIKDKNQDYRLYIKTFHSDAVQFNRICCGEFDIIV
jgi:hypothetical protein